jgi:hypothetical protein
VVARRWWRGRWLARGAEPLAVAAFAVVPRR